MIPTGRTTMLTGPRVVGMTATDSSRSKSMGRERRATQPDAGDANAQGKRNEVFHEDRDEIERLTRRTTEFQKEFGRAKGAANTSWLQFLKEQKAETVAPCAQTQRILNEFGISHSTKMRD
jgi:hypothetical protein